MAWVSRYVADAQGATGLQGACDYTETQIGQDGKLIGDEAESDWLKVTPWGFRLMLGWVNNRSVPLQPAPVIQILSLVSIVRPVRCCCNAVASCLAKRGYR